MTYEGPEEQIQKTLCRHMMGTSIPLGVITPVFGGRSRKIMSITGPPEYSSDARWLQPNKYRASTHQEGNGSNPLRILYGSISKKREGGKQYTRGDNVKTVNTTRTTYCIIRPPPPHPLQPPNKIPGRWHFGYFQHHGEIRCAILGSAEELSPARCLPNDCTLRYVIRYRYGAPSAALYK